MIQFIFWASIFTGLISAVAAANASSVDVSLAIFIEMIGVIAMSFGIILSDRLNDLRMKSEDE